MIGVVSFDLKRSGMQRLYAIAMLVTLASTFECGCVDDISLKKSGRRDVEKLSKFVNMGSCELTLTT